MEEALKGGKEAPTVINVYPINKGRRILLFLADFFICFLISFLLCSVAVYPIGYAAIHYSDTQERADEANQNINVVLSGSGLVCFQDSSDKSDLDSALSYTFDLYMSDVVNEVPFTSEASHDVFYTYYVEKMNDKDRYFDLYVQFDKKFSYFNIDRSKDYIPFSDTYKAAFEPLKTGKDALSDDASDYYETMFNKFFLTYYSQMLADVNASDLTVGNLSYVNLHQTIVNANKIMDNLLIVSSVISYVLGWLVCYLIVPLANQYRKTIGMMMMKIHRIDIHSMKILSGKQVAGYSVYSVFTNMMMMCFLPLLVMSVEYIFNLTITLWLSVASLFIVLVSMVFLLCSKSNQSLCDSITRSAYISNDSLDEIFRARGYYI